MIFFFCFVNGEEEVGGLCNDGILMAGGILQSPGRRKPYSGGVFGGRGRPDVRLRETKMIA